MNNKIPIVFALDDNWTLQAGVAITSLLLSADENTFYSIHIFHASLSQDNQDILRNGLSQYSNHEMSFVYCGDFLSEGFEIRNITKTAYLRLLIPRLLKDHPKVLYADVDTVFTDDLRDAYNHDIGESAVAGVATDTASNSHLKKIECKRPYINSGFLVFQPSSIHDEDVEKCLHLAKTTKLFFQDQDIINIVFQGRIYTTIPPRFNFTPRRMLQLFSGRNQFLSDNFKANDINNILSLKGMIHFTGAKPWNDSKVIAGDLWWHYYRMSPFQDHEFYLSYLRKVRLVPPVKLVLEWLGKSLLKMKY